MSIFVQLRNISGAILEFEMDIHAKVIDLKYDVAKATQGSVHQLWILDEHAELLNRKIDLLHLLDWVCIQDIVHNDLVLVLDLNFVVSTKTCSVCSSVVGLRQCGRCRNVYYCSAPCQRQAWLTHRVVCKPLL